jgi:hypothetical protein
MKVLKQISKKRDRGIEWTDLVHDMESCRAVVNEVINFKVP